MDRHQSSSGTIAKENLAVTSRSFEPERITWKIELDRIVCFCASAIRVTSAAYPADYPVAALRGPLTVLRSSGTAVVDPKV